MNKNRLKEQFEPVQETEDTADSLENLNDVKLYDIILDTLRWK